MPCPTLDWKTMSAYLAEKKELPAETRAHIDNCPECQEQIKKMKLGCVSR
ncbi:MAG: hypothetical protein ABIH38_04115 [Patescibacteria group bacterium]